MEQTASKDKLHPYRCEICDKSASECQWKFNDAIRHVGCATFMERYERVV